MRTLREDPPQRALPPLAPSAPLPDSWFCGLDSALTRGSFEASMPPPAAAESLSKVPDEARMYLLTESAQPQVSRYYWVHQHLHVSYDPGWIKFIPDAHEIVG